MSINKLALIRYKTIDMCLQNRGRKWTLDDLMEACSDALYEYEGITDGVSRRTIQLDLQNMRSEKLGYNAPIVVKDKKYYTYSEKNYSITNTPITEQDLGTLSEVLDVLKQFKGFGYFQELNGMLTRLEDKLYTQQNKGKSYIDFEKNELLRGIELIDPLHKALVAKMVLEITYQSFKARTPQAIVFVPYLLKEYRNRWFLLGMNKKNKSILTLALDRIKGIKDAPQEKFIKCPFDTATYFDDAIGVSKLPEQKTYNIVFKVTREHAPYIITKPMHASQKILQKQDDGVVFSIDVIWNFELEREILGLGEFIKILGPRRLRDIIRKRAAKMWEQYQPKEKE